MIGDLIEKLESEQQQVKKEDYIAWTRDRVTQRFFSDVNIAVLSSLDDTYDSDGFIHPAAERQGAKKFADSLHSWMPLELIEDLG